MLIPKPSISMLCVTSRHSSTLASASRGNTSPPRSGSGSESRFEPVGARVSVELDNAEWYESGPGLDVYGGGGSESLAGWLESPHLGSCLFAIFLTFDEKVEGCS